MLRSSAIMVVIWSFFVPVLLCQKPTPTVQKKQVAPVVRKSATPVAKQTPVRKTTTPVIKITSAEGSTDAYYQVVAVNAKERSLVVKGRKSEQVIRVARDAKITKAGKKTSLAKIKAGDEIAIGKSEVQDGKRIAVEIIVKAAAETVTDKKKK